MVVRKEKGEEEVKGAGIGKLYIFVWVTRYKITITTKIIRYKIRITIEIKYIKNVFNLYFGVNNYKIGNFT